MTFLFQMLHFNMILEEMLGAEKLWTLFAFVRLNFVMHCSSVFKESRLAKGFVLTFLTTYNINERLQRDLSLSACWQTFENNGCTDKVVVSHEQP